MAYQRSRRLRKKMRIDEFQEIGFIVTWSFPEGTAIEQVDATIDQFIGEVFEKHDLSLKAAAIFSGKVWFACRRLASVLKSTAVW